MSVEHGDHDEIGPGVALAAHLLGLGLGTALIVSLASPIASLVRFLQ